MLIDLHQTGLDIAEVVTALKSGGNPLVVGFGAHVAADVLQQARLAGCDLVQPRSQFFADLAENLPTWFRPAEDSAMKEFEYIIWLRQRAPPRTREFWSARATTAPCCEPCIGRCWSRPICFWKERTFAWLRMEHDALAASSWPST